MTEQEFMAVCPLGHRSYLRLIGVRDGDKGRCSTCGQPAEPHPLPPSR